MSVWDRYDRATVGRPPDANLGPVRSRSPETVAEMRRLRASGTPVESIAEQFGVNKRTAYRWLHAPLATRDVTVAGWRATFEIRETGPVRVSPWVPA